MSVDVSFIIPVYNASNYLYKCIESVFMQDNISKEIILINDGSTDDSYEVCKELSEKYDFIKFIDKINEGVSKARNVGIEKSIGRYLCFLDADDYYCENFASYFVKLCEEYQLDIIRGFYKIFEEDNNNIIENKKNIDYKNQVLSGEDFLVKSINSNCNEVVPWLGFFRREFVIQNNLCFPAGIAYEEDQLFFLQALLCKNVRVMQTDLYFYMYVKRKGSCTATPKVSNIEDACYITKKEIELINSLKLSEEVKHAANIYAMWSFFQVSTLYGRIDKNVRKSVYHKIPSVLLDHAIKYSTNSKIKFKFVLLKHVPRFYLIVFNILRGSNYN